MKIEKAIEILEAVRHTGHYHPTLDDVDAIELSIEALKRIHAIRTHRAYSMQPSLPGETED